MRVEKIILWMVEAARKTIEGNWTFTVEEITHKFNISKQELEEMKETIIDTLYLREEVSIVTFEDDEFYITFYTDYCPNHEDDEEDDEE